MRRLLLCVVLVLWGTLLKAQYEGMDYYWEQDPAVKAKLEQWQDIKFGFFVLGDLIARKDTVSRGRFARRTWIGYIVTQRFLMMNITGITWI